VIKLFQNRVAESVLTLPLTAAFTLVVWLLSGLVAYGWWSQLLCFVVTTYLMIELSNGNALLRVRSRMISCTFMALSCSSCFLLNSLPGGIAQLCMVAATIILFHTYQDQHAPGWTYYGFLCVGLASLVFVQTFFLVPVIWVLMQTNLRTLNWRSWWASVFGLLTPYWFALAYFIFQKNPTPLVHHFAALGELPFPYDYTQLECRQIIAFLFTLLLILVGAVHFWLRSFEDKIRIRQFYGYFTTMSFSLTVLLIVQPQHYDIIMRMLVVMASPLYAHFVTHTHTKATNILFVASIVITVLITSFNLLFPYLSVWIGS
jgi:hypothetical protein